MNQFSKKPHKLLRDGTSQNERQVVALSPDQVKVDDRGFAQWLQFLHQYARQLNFYLTDPEKHDGDWTLIFQNSIPVQIALIAHYDLESIADRFEVIEQNIIDNPKLKNLNLLFDLIFDMASQIQSWLEKLKKDESGLKRTIENLIDTNLRKALISLIRLANAAGKWGYLREKDFKALNEVWGINNPLTVFSLDTRIIQKRGSVKDKTLLGREILEELYRVFLKSFEAIIELVDKDDLVAKSLETNQANQPHLGLLFAFLKLKEKVDGELNGLSRKHLEFFYRKVLELKEGDAVPDKAHLFFELAKQVENDHKLKEGTLFKAGKDANGKDVFFKLEEEIIVDKAQIGSLRTLFIDQESVDGNIKVKNVYMAPIADSADGLGEKFGKEEVPSWKTLGAKTSKFINPDVLPEKPKDHPFARLGLILASKVLLLGEGERTVSISIDAEVDNSEEVGIHLDEVATGTGESSGTFKVFKVFFSGEEGWFQAPDPDLKTRVTKWGDSSYSIDIEVTLKPTAPAVFFPGVEFFEADYGHRMPMVKLELDPEDLYPSKEDPEGEAKYSLYQFFRELRVKDTCIRVNVCGVRNLIIQSDENVLDINKPFTPFGPIPKANSSNFYIGSKEIFSKNWKKIDVNVEWKDLPEDPETGSDIFKVHYDAYGVIGEQRTTADFIASVDVLSEKEWRPIDDIGNGNNEVKLFVGDSNSNLSDCEKNVGVLYNIKNEGDNKIGPCDSIPEPFESYTVDSICGFLRLKLGTADFLHEKYPEVLAMVLIDMANDSAIVPTVKHLLDSGEISLQDILDILVTANTGDGKTADDYLNSIVGLAGSLETTTSQLKSNVGELLEKVEETGSEIISNDLDDVIEESDEASSDATELNSSVSNANEKFDSYHSTIKGQTQHIKDLIAKVDDVRFPNPPYTPTIETLSLNYCAEDTICSGCETGEEETEGGVKMLHLYPFEGTYLTFFPENFYCTPETEETPVDEREYPAFLPKFTNEGTLYVGLRDLTPGSNLSLLFQMTESTANPDLDKAVVCWQYLRNNEWKALEPDFHVLSDGTEGFMGSGVINFSLPRSMSNSKTTIMPNGGLHWIKASARLRSDAVSETLAVKTQGARVVYDQREENDINRIATPLAKETIAKFVEGNAAIKSVNQEYPSFGGQTREPSSTFYSRVSEHLRHKGRGISLYDYERLVLQQFPEIFKVKCVTHTFGRRGPDKPQDIHLAPGFVTFVVIPDLRKRDVVDPIRPKVPATTLEKIKTFLKTKISPFVRLQVLNPRYEEIMVEAKVKFVKGKSVNFYLDQLKTDVKNFLAPWASLNEEQKISFGGTVYRSSILNFIEQKNYVDYVTDFLMKDQMGNVQETIVPRDARSIITSGKHEFLEIPDEHCKEDNSKSADMQGIGYSKVPNLID